MLIDVAAAASEVNVNLTKLVESTKWRKRFTLSAFAFRF